jgi:hypothetical protein
MSAAQYKQKFPGLVPSKEEMDSLKAVLGFQ